MCKIMIFGGTTEGRRLSEYCAKHGIEAMVSVVSDYGKEVLPKSQYIKVLNKRMDRCAIEALLSKNDTELVLDATHPYAVQATKEIKTACEASGTKYVRVLREASKALGNIRWVESVKQAVDILENTTGNIFVTTGSKELSEFMRLSDYSKRVYARVLPSSGVIKACEEMKIAGKHLICMQGPFSKELNKAMLEQTKSRYIVTKDGGTAGGFPEKAEAAAECNVNVIAIGRPPEEKINSAGAAEAEEYLKPYGCKKRSISLIGIGMGGKGQLTVAAADKLKESSSVLGAPRMLESVAEHIKGTLCEEIYLPDDVMRWLASHQGEKQVSIVYSGDTGFYSGMKKMAGVLSHSSEYEVNVFPGISSVSYMCARLKTGWEDVHLLSIHGRECDIAAEVKTHHRIFALLGGKNSVRVLCEKLINAGYPDIVIYVGERLSYEDERITKGTPQELKEDSFDELSVVLIERIQEGK